MPSAEFLLSFSCSSYQPSVTHHENSLEFIPHACVSWPSGELVPCASFINCGTCVSTASVQHYAHESTPFHDSKLSQCKASAYRKVRGINAWSWWRTSPGDVHPAKSEATRDLRLNFRQRPRNCDCTYTFANISEKHIIIPYTLQEYP